MTTCFYLFIFIKLQLSVPEFDTKQEALNVAVSPITTVGLFIEESNSYRLSC